MPVTLLPYRAYQPGIGGLVAARLRSWLGSNVQPPYPTGRQWLFSVTVHASLSQTYDRPLVVVEQLGYGVFTTLFRRGRES